ncbi:hypothetical protein [Novipirellula caenicola]|uniref:Uncharacterized protein n=1 Tax=Novipirellula caenicola TaxID=1536901 RepID=A0ABP9VZL2_9BACT
MTTLHCGCKQVKEEMLAKSVPTHASDLNCSVPFVARTPVFSADFNDERLTIFCPHHATRRSGRVSDKMAVRRINSRRG